MGKADDPKLPNGLENIADELAPLKQLIPPATATRSSASPPSRRGETMANAADRVKSSISRVIEERGEALVEAYYDERGPFAGRLFDELPNNDPNRFTPEDLVAASMLDVRFDPRAVRSLLVHPARVNDGLAALGDDRPLWEVDDLQPAADLWTALRQVPIGPTRTSKLLARKRPQMLPILDSVISLRLGLDGAPDRYALLREALQDASLRAAIDDMTPEGITRPSTLRLLDVATWMRFSESTNARSVREKNGLPVDPR